jgi:hypothetical protein
MPDATTQPAHLRPSPDGRHRSELQADAAVRDLAVQLGLDVARLARAEARLALLEGKQRARRVAVGVGMFGGAGMVAFLGACCLVEAFVLGLCNVMRPWFAALVTAGLLFLIALFIVLPGWKGVKGRRPITTDLLGNLKDDVEAVRQALPR